MRHPGNPGVTLAVCAAGLIALLCACKQKQAEAEKARAGADAGPAAGVIADETGTAQAAESASGPTYTGERVPYEGLWFNKEILVAYRETNSPSIAASNGAISYIAFAGDSVSVTWSFHWTRVVPIRFQAKDLIVLQNGYEIDGSMRIHDSSLAYRRFEDSAVHHFVKISDSANLYSFEAIDRLILQPPVVGEYQGDAGKHLRIGFDSIEGFEECRSWSVSLDYVTDGESSEVGRSTSLPGFDVINCWTADLPDPRRIAYQLQADSLLLFRIDGDDRITDTAGRFARKTR